MENQQKITQRYFQHVLRRYRMAMGLSQEQMSERIGVSKGFYSMMEIGRKWPNVDMILRIAESVGVRPGEIINALEDESKK